MRAKDFLFEYKYNYSLQDYLKVPYDDPNYEKSPLINPNRGPQEGKYLNLMLRGMKPVSVLDLPQEKKLFMPYIKKGIFVLAAIQKHTDGETWAVTIPGEEWRGKKVLELFAKLNDPNDRVMHSKIGTLLGIPKESIKYFINNLDSKQDYQQIPT